MIRLTKNGGVVTVQDHLAKLYVRNGFEVVKDEPKAEPKVEPKAEAPAPKKTTRKKKTQ